MLLIVWSALVNGDKRAREVDIQFCQESVAQTNKELPILSVSADVWCSPENARNYDEGARVANEIILKGSAAADKKDAAEKLLQKYIATKKRLAEYDEKRRAAYPLQIQLSSEYSGSSVILNGQFVAKLIPFCVLIVLTIVILLGFQQAAYKQQLVFLLGDDNATATDRLLRLARGQFFAGVTKGRTSFSRHLILTPERLAMGSLYVLLFAVFSAVLFAYIATIINLTDSIFVSYPFAVYAAAFVLGCLSLRTRGSYLECFRARNVAPRVNLIRRPRTIRAWVVVLAAIGFFTLLLPWASSTGSIPSLRGFEFLFPQHTIAQFGPVLMYSLDPRTFLEVRFQVWIALLFLLISALHGVHPFSGNLFVARALRKARAWLAILVLFLSLNYLIYMAILEYGGELEDNPLLSHLFSNDQGYPMNFYNPAYGFLIFLACCFILIWLSLRRRTDH
jgi:hypothetical protein